MQLLSFQQRVIFPDHLYCYVYVGSAYEHSNGIYCNWCHAFKSSLLVIWSSDNSCAVQLLYSFSECLNTNGHSWSSVSETITTSSQSFTKCAKLNAPSLLYSQFVIDTSIKTVNVAIYPTQFCQLAFLSVPQNFLFLVHIPIKSRALYVKYFRGKHSVWLTMEALEVWE